MAANTRGTTLSGRAGLALTERLRRCGEVLVELVVLVCLVFAIEMIVIQSGAHPSPTWKPGPQYVILSDMTEMSRCRSAVPQLMVGGGDGGRKTPGKHGLMRFGRQQESGGAFSKGGKGPRIARRGGNPRTSRSGRVEVARWGRSHGAATVRRMESTAAGRWAHYGPRARGILCPSPRLLLAKAA